MWLPCSRARAVFASEGVQLVNAAPTAVVGDEHGGAFILRVEGLQVLEGTDPAPGSAIRLEVTLPLPEALLAEIREFAGNHRLPLAPLPPPPSELAEAPILAASHVPGRNLFVYCEEPVLHVRALDPQTLELAVTGAFRSRRVPCREADVVVHLTPAAMGRLLSYLLVVGQASP
jgi:hypothetical protein